MPTTATDGRLAVLGKLPVSPWMIFWIASIAVFLVSLDSTMLFAAFKAVRANFPDSSAADLS